MAGKLILLIVIIFFGYRLYIRINQLRGVQPKLKLKAKASPLSPTANPRAWQSQLRTVMVLTRLNTKRFFRDRLAQFFAILFPLIFLFVFGSLNRGGGNVSFHVALLDQSKTVFARQFAGQINNNKTFKVNSSATDLASAEDKLGKNQVDGIIILPAGFGVVQPGQNHPSGSIEVLYSQSNSGAGQTLTSVLSGFLNQINSRFIKTSTPFTVVGKQLNQKRLTNFDYTFSGLLGFSIIGLGVFGPVNVFPELKKQGILRRLHTTPLRVWQYFLATMFSQAITGIISIAAMFIVAIGVFNLKVDGDYLEIFAYVILSIFMILGLGLAIGGWAKNERQAAPLSNIVVFPMLFLSGTFFPRFLMPGWLQTVTNYLPLTPVIDGLRLLTTEGKHLIDVGPQLGLIAIWFVVIYFVAFRVFRWE